MRGSGAELLFHEGEVTVWKLDGPLKTPCGQSNAPLRDVPDTP